MVGSTPPLQPPLQHTHTPRSFVVLRVLVYVCVSPLTYVPHPPVPDQATSSPHPTVVYLLCVVFLCAVYLCMALVLHHHHQHHHHHGYVQHV